MNWYEKMIAKIAIKKAIKFLDNKIFNMKSSIKTTIMGWTALVMGLLAAGIAVFDGDPSTKPDMEQISQALIAVGVTIPVWLGFLFARDDDVTSEEAKASKIKKPPA